MIVGAERTQEALFLGVGAREEDRLQGEAIRNDGRGHPTAGMSEFLHEETLIEETQATPAVLRRHVEVHEPQFPGLSVDRFREASESIALGRLRGHLGSSETARQIAKAFLLRGQ